MMMSRKYKPDVFPYFGSTFTSDPACWDRGNSRTQAFASVLPSLKSRLPPHSTRCKPHDMASVNQIPRPPYLNEADANDGAHAYVAYQSVSMHSSCRNMSFEELRLQEYNARQKTTKPSATNTPTSFASKVYPVAGPTHCRKLVRASRDDTRRYATATSYPEESR